MKTYKDIVKYYSDNATLEQMLKLTDITNDFIEHPYDKQEFFEDVEDVFCKFLTAKQAKHYVARMENSDNSLGEHWDMETTSRVWREKGYEDKTDDYNLCEVYYVMNMVYSDYYPLYKDDVDAYVDHTYLFLTDKDYKNESLSKTKWYATTK